MRFTVAFLRTSRSSLGCGLCLQIWSVTTLMSVRRTSHLNEGWVSILFITIIGRHVKMIVVMTEGEAYRLTDLYFQSINIKANEVWKTACITFGKY